MTSTPSRTAERAELIRGLGALCERPDRASERIAAALKLPEPDPVDHTDLFVQQLPPYASVYLDESGKIGGEARDRIAGFWRAMHLTPPPEPDHLASLLFLWASINDQVVSERDSERQSLLGHASTTLVREHVAPWLPPYLTRVVELSERYGSWAGLVASVVEDTLVAAPSSDALPVHLAVEPRGLEGSADLVAFLLTPIRSGMILTRADLKRAADELGLAIRIGERAFVLRSLLEQDADATTQWMADEARRQADLHASASFAPAIAAEWSRRAIRARELITLLSPV